MQNKIHAMLLLSTIALAGSLLNGCNSKVDDAAHEGHTSAVSGVQLNYLLKPTNEFVLSKVPVTTLQTATVSIKTEVLGTITYDTRQIGAISSRVSGRIERLYVRFRYQKIRVGQKIMDIYSPELLTYQQNLIFLLNSDPVNTAMIAATKERLLVGGMSEQQLAEVVRTKQPSNIVSIYSMYGGHVHDAESPEMPSQQSPSGMKEVALTTESLNLKEGMYVVKGKTVLEVYSTDRAWALLQIYADQQGALKRGDNVLIEPETAPDKRFEATIDYIEPFYRKENKTISARVYFNNARLRIPIGCRIKATISSGSRTIDWLPDESVVSLGRDNVVFMKVDQGFTARRIVTGVHDSGRIEITSGLQRLDTVAANGQFLMDSESFIKVSR